MSDRRRTRRTGGFRRSNDARGRRFREKPRPLRSRASGDRQRGTARGLGEGRRPGFALHDLSLRAREAGRVSGPHDRSRRQRLRGVETGREVQEVLRHYVKPQNDGWIAEKTLSWWGVYLNQHNTGAPWDVMFLYEYQDMTGLARRDNAKEAVRARLRKDPEWKVLSDTNQSVRTEDQVIIADPILPR